jgi:AcrR family transcriptional regulator
MIGRLVERHETKKAAIVAAAWELASSDGIGGLSLRALAARVGMRQPSLYEYFDSKHALYDAMFAEGNRQLLDHLDGVDLPENPRTALKEFMRAFVDFALEDHARLELLFERPVPGFRPSPESYVYAEKVLNRTVELLREAGLGDPGDVDCFVAMIGGLVEAQASNDPGGARWIRHLDRMIDLHLDNATHPHNKPERMGAK